MESKVFPRMNTLVKMQEHTLLSQTEKAQLRLAPDGETMLKILTSADFFRFAHPQGPEQIPAALEDEMAGWLHWAGEIAPAKAITDLFSMDAVEQNLRLFVKEQVLQRELGALYRTDAVYSRQALTRLMGGEPVGLPEERTVCAALEAAIRDYTVHRSMGRIDLAIKLLRHRLEAGLARESGDPQIEAFIGAAADLDTLGILAQLRVTGAQLYGSLPETAPDNRGIAPERLFALDSAAQEAFLATTPYAGLWAAVRAKGWDRFDLYADNYLLGLCRKAKLQAFGTFPLFAFLFAKRLDIRNAGILFAAKQVRAEPEEIGERLRDEYTI